MDSDLRKVLIQILRLNNVLLYRQVMQPKKPMSIEDNRIDYELVGETRQMIRELQLQVNIFTALCFNTKVLLDSLNAFNVCGTINSL